MEKLKIFISGTQDDMRPERDAVDLAVNSTTLATGIRAETAFSQPQPSRAWIEQQLRECNIYIGVYSHRYGWVIPGENVSATEFEFNLARQLRKPILVWIRKLREDEKIKSDFERQEQFLRRVSDFSTGYLRQVFDHPADLEQWVASALGETFTEIIRRDTRPTTSDFFVPFPHNPRFVGRDADLATLHEMLQQGNSPVGIRPTVLVGLGGIGKTQLAVEYAHAHRAEYPGGIFWLNAIEPLLFEFARLAEKLELADAEMPRDRAAHRAWKYLNQRPDVLVIFDNVLEPADLNVPFTHDLIPANLQCHTLFTTRKRDFPSLFQPFEVKTLPQAAAMQLLLRHPSRQPILDPKHPDHGLALVICITLGYLPLALELAAAFLGEYPDISLFKYRVRLLDEGAMEVVDATQLRPEDMPTRHETAVRATLRTSWDALMDENARLALRAVAQLGEAEFIPIARIGLLTGLATEAKPGHPIPLTQALQKLYTAALIEELTTDRLRLHPLVHAFASRFSPPTFRAEMAAHVAHAFSDLSVLQTSVIERGIDQVLNDLRTGLQLCANDERGGRVFTKLSSLEHVLDQEAFHLRGWDSEKEPGFLLQQLCNRSLEVGHKDLKRRVEAQLVNWKLPHLRERFPVSRESKAVVRTIEGHTSAVNGVAVTADGHLAVSASQDRTLKVWDLNTGHNVRTLEGHRSWVNGVAVTADGHWAVSASQDDTIRVWDIKTGQAIRTFEEHTRGVDGVAVTADGHWAVSVQATTLKIWDLKTGQAVRTLEGHTGRVNGVAVTADGRRAVSASSDKTLKVWDIKTGYNLRTLEGHTDGVNGVAVTADGRRVVSASEDGTLKVWDLKTGQAVHTLEGHTDGVNGVAVTADGRRAASASGDKTLKIWNLETGRNVRTLEGHTDGVNGVAVTVDGRRAVSASGDGTLKVWDIKTRQASPRIEGHADSVTSVALSAEGAWAVSASEDKTFTVWDLSTWHIYRTLKSYGSDVRIRAVIADRRRVVLAHRQTLSVWDVKLGRAVHTLNGHADLVNSVAMIADGRRAISGSKDKTLKIWDLETGRPVRTLKGHAEQVYSVAVTADGRRAVSASGDGTLKVWNLGTGYSVRTLKGHAEQVHSVAVTADGRRAVSASTDKTIKVWDLKTGEAIRTFEGDTRWGTSLAVTTDGRWVVSVSDDNILKVWDITSGQAVLSLAAAVPLICCAILPDNQNIVAGDSAGAVHFVEWVKFDSERQQDENAGKKTAESTGFKALLNRAVDLFRGSRQ